VGRLDLSRSGGNGHSSSVTIKGQNINIEATAKYTLKGNPIHLNP
jgi:hypothetical protein